MNTTIANQSSESTVARTARLYASAMAPSSRAPSKALTPFQVDQLVLEIVVLETRAAQPS